MFKPGTRVQISDEQTALAWNADVQKGDIGTVKEAYFNLQSYYVLMDSGYRWYLPSLALIEDKIA